MAHISHLLPKIVKPSGIPDCVKEPIQAPADLAERVGVFGTSVIEKSSMRLPVGYVTDPADYKDFDDATMAAPEQFVHYLDNKAKSVPKEYAERFPRREKHHGNPCQQTSGTKKSSSDNDESWGRRRGEPTVSDAMNILIANGIDLGVDTLRRAYNEWLAMKRSKTREDLEQYLIERFGESPSADI